MNMFLNFAQFFLALYFVNILIGCADPSNGAGVERYSSEYSNIQKGQKATEAAATDSKGLTNGSDITVLSTFTPSTDCAVSGWPATGTEGDVGYAMRFLLCSVLKSPDGPDTVRGGFDRITGFLCAIGSVVYDNAPKSITFTFSTACFSQNFVTTACTFFNGSNSTGPCSTTATVTGFSSTTGVAPAEFEKYLTVSLPTANLNYTIAYTANATTISGACMDNLPTANDNEVKNAFAFYIDSTSGKVRYEGRFPDTNKRHMRINLIGTVSTNFEVSNINMLSFVQGENFSGGGGLIVSVHGTPPAGRKIRILNTSNMSVATPVWTAANADDTLCIGEVGAACVANTGIVQANANPKRFFFDTGTGFTTSKNWFTNNSYLGAASDTVDMDDLWD
jgi:hypothetical protein